MQDMFFVFVRQSVAMVTTILPKKKLADRISSTPFKQLKSNLVLYDDLEV